LIESTEIPAVRGLSSHSSFKVTSPLDLPFTINFVASSENFAVTPGDVDTILNSAFISNPLPASSSNSIFLLLLTTLLPVVGDTPDPYSILYSLVSEVVSVEASSAIATTL